MAEWKSTQPQIQYNVLLIGDSCIDEYKIGSVDRLSPEAPVPVVKVFKEYTVPGMASNVRLNLQKLGIDPDFITNDQTITKTRYIDSRSGQHLLRVDNEPKVVSWSGKSAFPISSYDAVIISDYNKGFLDYNQISDVIKQASGPVFIDTKKQDLSAFHGAIIKINEAEYKARYSINDRLIVTLGSEGAMLREYNDEKIFPTKKVDVVDVCGCGDTFLASLVFKYLESNNMDHAIIFANKAACITVQHQGNYAPTMDEILNA